MAKERCGDCFFFDVKGVDGKAFGVKKDGSDAGVCRGPFGLTMGVRTPDLKCMQQPGVFRPKANPTAENSPLR